MTKFAESNLLTPPQAAALLQVPVSFIYERTRRNAIPLRRVGKYVRLPREELMEWVAEQTKERSEALAGR